MKILICFGTRPEYIKVKSLIEHLPNVKTCFTGQHANLLNNLNVNYNLSMEDNISDNRLNNIFCNILNLSISLKKSKSLLYLLNLTFISLPSFFNKGLDKKGVNIVKTDIPE